MLKTAVYKWLQRFETGRESLEDDRRSGRPATPLTHENVRRVECISLKSTSKNLTLTVMMNKVN